ncbi:NAD(P)-dependent oxidoreductase [Streptomyces sp. NPDC047028]|uniref:NAD(P)-dependent oxidoreductase n=1 Tax=Streptomyces sp. NPDC047028 TaxID=3155793 RepID=UPI0033DC4867
MSTPVAPATAPPNVTVGVIGLGTMGGRAAAALTASGIAVVGHDIDEAARSRAAGDRVTVVSGSAAVARAADIVLLSLPEPADVLSVVAELVPAAAGRLVVDLSTVEPATSRRAGAQLAAAGARFVDAPVLGRPSGCGGWTLPAGGSDEDVAAVAGLAVGTIAKAVEPVGPVGTGSLVKILNNLMFGAINTVTAEVIDLAERAGMPADRFVDVVRGSGAATVSPLFNDVGPRMVRGEHEPTFSLALLHKDVRLGAALATALSAPAEVTHTVLALTAAAHTAETGALDTSVLIDTLRARRATT